MDQILAWGLALALCLALPLAALAQDPETIGLFRPNQPTGNNTYFLRNANTLAAPANTIAGFGNTGDLPVVGDWDSDGITTIGVFRPNTPVGTNTFFLRNTNNLGIGDITIEMIGQNGDIPVVGDWDGDGTTTVGLFRPNEPLGSNTFFLWNNHTSPPGPPDITIFGIGAVGDLPIVGDWDGSGTTTVGVFRPNEPLGTNTFFLWNDHPNPPGAPDITVAGFGAVGDLPIAGDWDANETTTIGLFRPDTSPTGTNTFFLLNTNALGPPDIIVFGFGAVGDRPVAGRWGNNPPVLDPTTFSVVDGSANGAVVGTVTFSDPDNPGDTHTFSIEGGNTGGAFTIGATSGQITVATSAAVTSANAPFSLTVRVTDDGTPAFSDEATITVNVTAKQGQTISFTSTAPAAATVGGPTYTVTATATSGLAVTFTIDGSASSVCSLAGSTVSFIGVGTCVINANQAGDATFAQAPQVQQSFAVGKGSQTITFTSVAPTNATVGGPTYNVTATATSGLTVTFTIDAAATTVCSIAGSTVSFIGNGTCVINANQAGDANYDPAPQVQQSFAVKSNQTITFTSTAPTDALVGGPTYAVTATATSGLTVTFTIDGSASTVCSVVGSTVSFIGAGTCVINANQPGDANFHPAPQVQQSFTVKQSQTITFTSVAPNPALYQGPTYNATATATSGLAVTITIDAAAASVCSLAGSTVSFIGTGTCIINANQGGNATFAPAPQVQQSFAVVPNVVNDAYSALGNVIVDSSNGPNTPFSVADNDTFPAGATISAFDATSLQGGTVTMVQIAGATLGRFTYNPPVGFTGSDTFTYTVSSNGQTRAGTVTFTVIGKVWFLNNNAGACPAAPCNGRLTHPFVDTSNFQAVNTSGTAPNPTNDDAIFVYSGAATYSGATILRDGQRLVGQGASGTLAALGNVTPQNGQTLPTTGGTAPVLTSSGVVVTTGSGNFIHGLTLGDGTTALSGSNFGTLTVDDNVAINTTGGAINLTTGTFTATLTGVTSTGGTNNINLVQVAGTSTVVGGALSGASSRAIDIAGGTGTFTYAGTITNTGSGIRVQNKTGSGTVALSDGTKTLNTGANGAVTITGNSAGTTIIFTGGGLDIDTTTGAGFTATGGGTVIVSGASNTITTTSGTAVNVATTIGASGLTFQSISHNGNNTAIALANTGTGTFSVTGTGTTDGSGGTIENIAGSDAITLNNTGGLVTLQNMIIEDISAAGDTTDAQNTRSGVDAISGLNVNGGLTLENVTIRRISDSAIYGAVFGGTDGNTVWNGLTINNSVIEDTNRFHVSGKGDANNEGSVRILGIRGTVNITNNTFQRGAEFLDFFVTADTLNMTVTNNQFLNAYKEFVAADLSPLASVGGHGVDVTVQGSANANITIGDRNDAALGNTFLNGRLASLRVGNDAGATGTVNVTIGRNIFRSNDHSSGVFCNPGCQSADFDFPMAGVLLFTLGTTSSVFNAIVDNNLFDEATNASGGVGQLTLAMTRAVWQALVTNNTFDTPGNAPWFVRADGNTTAARVKFLNNTGIRGAFCSTDAAANGGGCNLGGGQLCPGAAGYCGPGLRALADVQNGGILHLTVDGDDFAEHDAGFDPGQTFEARSGVNLVGNSLLCANVRNSTAPDGYSFEQFNGSQTVNVFTVGGSGTCTAPGSPGSCQNALNANNNTGGASNPATDPPFVNVVGTVNVVGVACQEPGL